MIHTVSNPPTNSASQAARTIYLETFGCQMNELDSELVRGQLHALGYRFTDSSDHADVILYNTCSVREQAENKVWSRVGIMGLRKKEGADFILGVIGCMAERDGIDMIRRFPHIDLLCGPGELDKLPLLIDNACKTKLAQQADIEAYRGLTFDEKWGGRVALQGNNSRRSATLAAANDNLELLDLSRAFDPDARAGAAGGDAGGGGRRSAYVRITRGCNKFCTYCVVPYTRGAEVHRPPDAIIDECKKLADAGVIEITLLGQTVNHYIYTHGPAVSMHGVELPQIGPAFKNGSAKPWHGHAMALPATFGGARTTTFAQLLQRIHDEVPAIQRLRFVTSFPRDFGDDILHVMAACPRICKYLHVPAQSGSNRILKLMNRGYTVEQYLEFIERARAILDRPGVPASAGLEIAGDFIVGFPTETEEDFQLTKELLRRIEYKNSFIFKYSRRPGTVAIDRFAAHDEVPEPVKRRRNSELLALQSEISAQVHARYVGRTVNVFVENIDRAQDRSHGDQHQGDRHQGDRNQGDWYHGSPNRAPSSPRELARDARAVLTISAVGGNARAKPQAADAPGVSQLTGRTEGDIIVAFELPHVQSSIRAADDLLGCIVPVRITSAAPLLLRGQLA